jgi:predicted Ser/Thr protein kinase
MTSQDEIFEVYARSYDRQKQSELSLKQYLEACKTDPLMYASASERMVAAIGEPELVDSSKDPRISRIFMNRTVKVYPAFKDFYGLEETIERIVGFFRYAAQGLEERKQILYLLGPVGGGKSSLAERLTELMEMKPVYVLKAGDEISPIFESPLGLFDPTTMGSALEERYSIPKRKLTGRMSPWAVRPNRATTTIRISRHWSARSTSANLSSTARATPMPIRTPAASTARRRGCLSSSKCSKRRSRCCIRCSRQRRMAHTSEPRTSARCRTRA